MAIACMPAEWGANAILRPFRRPLVERPAMVPEPFEVQSEGIRLRGWLFRRSGPRQGLIVYLHGISDNRRGGGPMAERLVPQGWDVLAYDGRAHGESGGEYCTYGFHEKQDLLRALDAVGHERVVLFGSSLGAAVALQAAPLDPRIRGVIAEAPFASLDSIVRDRAPWIATRREVDAALRLAAQRGSFRVEEVSPEAAAARIRIPVLLIHGERDRETRPEHSRRIAAALAGPKRLLVVPGAEHRNALAGREAWDVIEAWLAALR